ncbi:MAG TPA: glucose 1-dehydrogenase [Bryobacteraceae bacterium]|nr:glucose 1-dehydrogenase [Bryobacteraceae bacterium]
MPLRLENKAAVVTGASRGIGRAIALGLAREGARVVVNYVTNRSAADEVVCLIRQAGGEAVAVHGDVSDRASHARILGTALDAFSRLDILVNNAGISKRQAFLEVEPDAFDYTLGVNLSGPFFLTQAAGRIMARSRTGKIINISSVHDAQPMPLNSAYCVAKSGLLMMTRCAALELAGSNIQVNCVSPGAILTDENSPRLEDPAYLARVLEKIPSRRIGSVEDVVGAVLLLASADSDYITGTVLYVDGGMLIHG